MKNFYEDENLSKSYMDIILGHLNTTKTFGIGIFDYLGEKLYTNDSFDMILNIYPSENSIIKNMINPDFNRIIQQNNSEQAVFKGVMTIGDGYSISNSYNSYIYNKNNSILILAEYDTEEIKHINKALLDLNTENNNLQRQVIKEKKELGIALEKLKETQQMLIQSEKMNALGNLVAGIAHEINNPIAFVNNNIHSMKDMLNDLSDAFIEIENNITTNNNNQNFSTEKIREKYDIDFILEDIPEIIEGSIGGLERVRKIVENLRVFSRLDEAEFKESDIKQNILSTLEIANPELTKREISVTHDLKDISPVKCNIAQLNQVFLNIIINASQAIDNNGKITLKLYEENNVIITEISDNGKGIPDNIKNNIFDPFFTTKPVGEGTGLGLSIAYKIITEDHGGDITVESEQNKGTTFKISIPRSYSNEHK